MPIPYRRNFKYQKMPLQYFYGILVRISPGYPPVQGRLHTRYSPVCRSPPKYCYLVLPLDLHVLSLPLAFILSQDQTLHCNISFLKYPLKINPVSSKTQTKSLGFWRVSLSPVCYYFIINSKNFSLFQFLERVTKILNSFSLTKLFSKVFSLFLFCPVSGANP